MRVLLTGASSFTGSWFVKALVHAGHTVTATFRGERESYQGQRERRVRDVQGIVETFWNLEFGDERFLDLVGSEHFDVFCHHAAEMANYRSWDFDVLAATASNTRSAREVLERLRSNGARSVVVTGSVFEPYEGLGDTQRRAFNPYGLSKHLSFEIFRLEAERLKLGLGKFVIPNPFGPSEELRFTSYLAKEWLAGRTPKVATPDYIRDNIHVSLLAMCYAEFVSAAISTPGVLRAAPSGYIESQGAFAHRMSRELASRLNCQCPVALAIQTDFQEPMLRVNAQPASPEHPDWSEPNAWDELAAYYRETFS